MNICMIAPNPNTRDGIAKYSYKLAEKISDSENSIFYLSPSVGGLVNEGFHFPLLGFSPKSVVNCFELLKAKNTKVIHLQYAIPTYGLMVFPIISLLLLSKTVLKTKVVITLHEVRRELNLLGIFGKAYFWILALIANEILVHTNEARDLLIKKCYVSDNKVKTLPLFLFPLSKFEKLSDIKRASKKRVVYFGYIHVDKGIQYFIDAIAKLKNNSSFDITKYEFVVAGDVRPRKGIFKFFEKKDFEYRDKIFSKVKAAGLEGSVIFSGFIPDKEVHSLLSSAHIFVLPYTNTEQSGVLYQLLPYETPIIASNVGGLGETLKGHGRLIPVGGVTEMANEITNLITDAKLYAQTQKNYLKIYQEHNLDVVAKKTILEYSVLLENKQ